MTTVADLVKGFHGDAGQHVTLLRKGISALDSYQRRSFSFIYLDYTYSIQLLEAVRARRCARTSACPLSESRGNHISNPSQCQETHTSPGPTRPSSSRTGATSKLTKGIPSIAEHAAEHAPHAWVVSGAAAGAAAGEAPGGARHPSRALARPMTRAPRGGSVEFGDAWGSTEVG